MIFKQKMIKLKKEDVLDFFVGDFETVTKNSNYYKSLKTGTILCFEIQKLGNYEDKIVGVTMKEFENWLLSLNKNSQLFFHNLSKFDGYIILNYALENWDNSVQKNNSSISYSFLKTNRGIISITIITPKCKIIISDSLLILSLSISKLGSILNFPKGETDYDIDPVDNFEQLPKEFREYLHRDVLILNHSLSNFKQVIETKFPELKWNVLTAGSLSRALIESVDELKDFKVTYSSHIKGKEFYRGGYTSYNEKLQDIPLNGEFLMIDAKSHYPSIIFNYDLPAGSPELIEEKDIDNYKIVFVKVKGTIKNSKFPWGGIYKNYNENAYFIEYKEGFYEFVFTGLYEEWKLQEKFYNFNNFKFLEIWGFEFTTKCLKTVIDKLYYLKETEKNNLTYKIILNSIYGSCGMNYNYPQIFYIDKKQGRFSGGVLEFGSKKYNYLMKKDTCFFKNYDAYDFLEIKDEEQFGAWNTWIAAFITSKGRYILQNFISMDPENVIYCDTDSILMKKEFKHLDKIPFGNKLGDWSIESEDITNLYVQGAKRYVLYIQNKFLKSSFAGVKKDIFDGKGFDYDVHMFRKSELKEAQRRVVYDDKWFPFIEDINYLNTKYDKILKIRRLSEKTEIEN